MQHNLINTRMLSLLAAGGIFCLLAGGADAQRSSGRRGGGNRASLASTSSTSGTTSGTSTSAASGSATANCPSGSSTSSAGASTGTTTTGTTTAATTSSLSSLSRSTTTPQVQSSSLGTGTVSAVRTAANQLAVQWVGNTNSVKAVYVAVLNANRQVLQQNAITQNPVQTSLTLSTTARYYGVQVVYANGTSSTMISAIK